MSDWLSCPDFASLAGFSRQKAHRALRLSAIGQKALWRGAHLVVRTVRGRGGKSGEVYEVLASSLPAPLQEHFKALQTADERPSNDAQARMDWAWWHAVLSPALAHPRGSAARGDSLREIAAKRHMRPDGRWKDISERTLHRKLAAYEKKRGALSLTRRERADKGGKRAVVTINFDRAFKGDDAAKSRIEGALRGYIRAQHKNLESHSNIVFKAARKLAALARAEGFDVPEHACQVPDHLVKAETSFRRIGHSKKDAKKFADSLPGIQRTFELYGPSGVVFGDVHHFDVIVDKIEGYQQYPKAIAWHDAATGRVWIDVVLLPIGEGIRNEHVIASFLRMALAWGMPRVLYLDNGSEYNFAEFINDAMALRTGNGERVVIHAKPYNARAKPIENCFRQIERHLAKLPGYIGGDRMKTKTSNVGQAPTPFGSFDEFRAIISAELAFYHAKKQHGRALNGRSPNDMLAEAVKRGWQKTEIDPNAFAMAFSTPEPRAIRQGSIRHKGIWRCDELIPFEGERVTVLIPKFQNWPVLPVKLPTGSIAYAREDLPYAGLDRAGAVESARRKSIAISSIRALDHASPSIDPVAESLELAASLPAPPELPVGHRITASDEAKAIGARLRETPRQTADREAADREARGQSLQETNQITLRMLAKLNARSA